jgi:protein involved in polysaccharide export with SLBB domain
MMSSPMDLALGLRPTGVARGVRGACVSAAVCMWVLLAGCADSRIRVADLRAMETALEAQPETVPVEDPKLLRLPDSTGYRVGPGDVLGLTLMGPTGRLRPAEQDTGTSAGVSPHRESLMRVRVGSDGTIVLPLTGKIPVGGLELSEVETAVIRAHVPDLLRELTVYAEVVDPHRTTAVVVGPGGAPRMVDLRSNERNVLYALARAGVVLAAITGRVQHTPARTDREPISYNLYDPVDLRRVMLAPPLESGDMIVLEHAPTSAVYVIGLVRLPGPVPIPAGASLSVLRAIASAGGLPDVLDPREGTLWRKLSSGEQVRVRLDLLAMREGTTPDVEMRSGDVLEIPHTLDTRARQWALENLRLGPFSLGVRYDPLEQYNFNRALRDDNRSSGFGNAVRDALLFNLVPTAAAP